MPEPQANPKAPQAKTDYFSDSNQVDPTPGWIPFVFVIGIAVVFVVGFVAVALLVR